MKRQFYSIASISLIVFHFLSCRDNATDPINTSPVACFTITPGSGTIETVFNFDASGCTDKEDPSSVLKVWWDWDGDNNWDTELSTKKTTSHQFSSSGYKIIRMQVVDTEGGNAYSTQQIAVGVEGGETGTVRDMDGNSYRTIKIGTQWWMAENLKTTHYYNQEAILPLGAYCDDMDDPTDVDVYGRLYNWYTVTDSRGISPSGWHVPTVADWQTLVDYLGGEYSGGMMKETGTKHWLSPNTGATNESGFSALPGRTWDDDCTFSGKGKYAIFWSSTQGSYTACACFLALGYDHNAVYIYLLGRSKTDGCSVRCVMDTVSPE
jgi:uncharacterized protein (TIGR02145 family)